MAPAKNNSRGIQYVIVDAFTGKNLRGNPAAICVVPLDADPIWMQRVAAEINVSQTAFLVKNDSTQNPDFDYELRWFTPVYEVPLCGHATLALAYYLFATEAVKSDLIQFKTKSGILSARKFKPQGSSFYVELDFPILSTFASKNLVFSLTKTLGNASVVAAFNSERNDLVLELSSQDQVENLQPNAEEISSCSDHGLLVTSKANETSEYDFVSRFFAPLMGIPEDPVCGSAHCILAPYWAKKLRKNVLSACQVSERGGKLGLEVKWETMRVLIRGEALIGMTGFVDL